MAYSRPRRRRGQPPIVSARPPNAPARAETPAPVSRRSAQATPGRVIAVFGPPGGGVSTILEILAQSTLTLTPLIRPDFGDLEEQVRGARGEAIFIDGAPVLGRYENGEVSGPDSVQYLYDRRLVFPGQGALVRVICDPEVCRQQGGATPAALETWFANLSDVERRIQMLDMPYFVIHNQPGDEGLTFAVGDLCQRAGVTR